MIKFILSLLFLTVQTLAITDAERAQLGIGNINYLTNPGFESGRGGWSASGGTFSTVASSSVQYGKGSVVWDSNAASQTLTSSQVIPLDSNNGLKGQSGLFSCFIKVTSGTATHKLQVYVGTTLFEQSIVSSTDGARTNLYFPISTASSQNLQLAGIISVASNEPEIIVDDCFLGLASGAGSGIGQFSAISEEINAGTMTIGATTTAPTKGTTTTDKVTWFRNGKFAIITYDYVQTTAGTAGSGDYLYSLPSGLKIDTTYNPIYTGAWAAAAAMPSILPTVGRQYTTVPQSLNAVAAVVYSTTQFRMGVQNEFTSVGFIGSGLSNLTTASYGFSFTVTVPIQGWSASQSAAAANQTDYGWTSYTPTFTGFGTVSVFDVKHRRIGDTLEVEGQFVSGTSTATEARMSLPNGLETAADYPTLQLLGKGNYSGSATTDFSGRTVLGEANRTYVMFGREISAADGLQKSNGNAMISSGQGLHFNFKVRIKGWVMNQRAPTLIGSVTSDYSGAINDCLIGVDSVAGVPTIDKNYGSCVSSITDNATGVSTVNFTAGKFSQAPVCTCTVFSVSGANIAHICHMETEPTTSSVQIVTSTTGTGDADLGYQLRCAGPR